MFHVKPWRVEPRGRFEQQTVRSRVLEGNPLGDPAERPLWVYLPPGAGDEPGRLSPHTYLIQGLLTNPEQYALLQRKPELMENAII